MKPAYLVILATALVIAAFWLALDTGKSSPQSQESSPPQKASQSPQQSNSTKTSNKRRTTPEKLTAADWAQIASELKHLPEQVDKFKPSPEFQKRLAHYSKGELISALQLIRAEPLTDREKLDLRRYLLALIVQRDPADFCRDPYAARLYPETRTYWERYALTEWTRTSPVEAVAWFESISLDTHEQKQLTALEHNLFSTLIIADFDQAKTRYLATPEKQRQKIMNNYDGFGSYWTEADFQNHNIAGRFAELSRLSGNPNYITWVIGSRGEKDRPAGISRIQESLQDWPKGHRAWLPATTVADYFKKINATPEEQKLCLDAVVHHFKYFQKEADPNSFRQKYTQELQEFLAEK